MNQAQALAKLRKILGPKLGVRIDKHAPDAEQRELNRAAFREAKRIAEEAEAARMARLNELLKGDAVYQQLKAAAKAASEAKEQAAYGCHRKRIEVGVDRGLFFSIQASGDNWQEVVDIVTGAKQ